MEFEEEINKLVEELKTREGQRRYPHLARASDEDLRLFVRIAINGLKDVPSYSTSEIIKMASKQRARSEGTSTRHKQVAIDMAVLVRVLQMKRDIAALVLSYAQWSEYAPGAIKDFYKRHLPEEYKNRRGLELWLEQSHGGLKGFKINLINKIERFDHLCKKAPQVEINKLLDDATL